MSTSRNATPKARKERIRKRMPVSAPATDSTIRTSGSHQYSPILATPAMNMSAVEET